MAITPEQVKALRSRTGVSVMECKKALEEADGDMEKAAVILRKKSGAAAAKKSDRTLGAGTVAAYVHAGHEVGAMVLLTCETDFVAKNDAFVRLAYELAMHVAAANPQFVRREDVKEEEVRAAREVFEKEAADKPEAVRTKIVEGKMDAYLKERVLLEQPFIKDETKTVGALIQEAVQKFGERIEVEGMARLSARG